MSELKDKLMSIYITNKTYINITFTMLIIGFSVAIRNGDLKSMIEVLKVTQVILNAILTAGG